MIAQVGPAEAAVAKQAVQAVEAVEVKQAVAPVEAVVDMQEVAAVEASSSHKRRQEASTAEEEAFMLDQL